MNRKVRKSDRKIRQFQYPSHANKTDPRHHQEDPTAWKQRAGKDDDEQVKRDVIAVQISCKVKYGGDDGNIGGRFEGRPVTGNPG